MSKVIRELQQDKGLAEDLILETIEKSLTAAYKQYYGRDENAVVRFSEDNTEVSILSKMKIVDKDDVCDSLLEIDIDEARELNPDAEVGDEILVEIDPKIFDRRSIKKAKHATHQTIKDIQKDSLYSEFKDKVGEIIIGYYQRERDGVIYVDLGKTEGELPKKFQSPRETYHLNDRIKALIASVEKNEKQLHITLSRTHKEFVQAIFELEVPEIYDNTVVIHNIVREPGSRTKLAVYSNREDVDPVGACVGLKGVRIQAVIKELEGEKIDILKYDPDPRRFIKNALSPAEVRDVIILDENKHQALAIVSDSMLSLAIGKQGINVRLANRLVDWNIDVKTESQFAEMDIKAEARTAISNLFGDSQTISDEIYHISELPGVDSRIAQILLDNGVDFIEDFIKLGEDELKAKGLKEYEVETLRKLIDENVEIIEDNGEEEDYDDIESENQDDEYEEETEEEEYECPECHAKITVDMTTCPNCGIGLSFEYEEEE